MKRYRGEDYRWNLDRPVNAGDFNETNSVAIFAGPLLDMYPGVTTEELGSILRGDERSVIVDVRSRKEYEDAHICGAVNIPLASIEEKADRLLKKDDLIIVCGHGPASLESAVGADKFVTMMFEKVIRYTGGLEEWTNAGLCTEGGTEGKVPKAA